jgi:hypothetical protein
MKHSLGRKFMGFKLFEDARWVNSVSVVVHHGATKFRPDRTSNIVARWSPWTDTFAYKQHYLN